ncbi:MAG: ABC transporter substrate-binding protein [Chloroflexi bacterium]|nr:ABC transporter substrate-binding protein [Chloroflexota bacterium]
MRTLTRVLFVLVLLTLTAPALAQEEEAPVMGFWEECESPTALPETVNIGAIFVQSGNASVYGIVQTQAVEMAVAEINEAGYLGEGVELVVTFADSAGVAEQAIGAMESLLESGVVAVLGPTLSTEAFSADPIAQEAGVVVMGVSNTAGGITDMGEFVFRDSLPESSVIPGTIATATEVLGLEQVAVLYGNDDDFTLSGYDVFITALEENEVEVLAEATFARGDVDFSAQLTSLVATEPDAIVVSALAAEATQIIVQARQAGYEGPIIGGNGLNSPAVLTGAGEASDGVIVGAAWNIASPEDLSALFAAAYEEAYEARPDQFAAQAYTGAWLMATAIRCADSAESADIRDALAEIVDFPSPLGLFSFDENRNPVHAPVVQIAEGGAFAVLGADAEE